MLMLIKGSARKETLGTGQPRVFTPNLQKLTGYSLHSSIFFGIWQEHHTQDIRCIYLTKHSVVKEYLHHYTQENTTPQTKSRHRQQYQDMVTQQLNLQLAEFPHGFCLQGFDHKYLFKQNIIHSSKMSTKQSTEKHLHLLGTSKAHPNLPRWKNHNIIFFLQTYSRFKCCHGVKGAYQLLQR